MMDCPCLPDEVYWCPVTDMSHAKTNLQNGRLMCNGLCRGCGHVANDVLPILVATPCRMDNQLHMSSFYLCTNDACQSYFDKLMGEVSSMCLGLVEVLGRVPYNDSVVEVARQRVLDRLQFDPFRACAECGRHNWCLKGTNKWTNDQCGRCMRVWYCGRECQRKHWKSTHKTVCVRGERLDRADPSLLAVRQWMHTKGYIRGNINWAAALCLFRSEEAGMCARPGCRMRLDPGCLLQVTINLSPYIGTKVLFSRPITFCCVRCSIECAGKHFDAEGARFIPAKQFEKCRTK